MSNSLQNLKTRVLNLKYMMSYGVNEKYGSKKSYSPFVRFPTNVQQHVSISTCYMYTVFSKETYIFTGNNFVRFRQESYLVRFRKRSPHYGLRNLEVA